MKLYDGEQAGHVPAWADEEEPMMPDPRVARLRYRQACERLAERYPRAAKDPQLASTLAGLGDALGAGPEAAEPDTQPENGASFGRLLAPDLAIAVDSSACIVLIVTEPQGKQLRVVTVADVEAFKAALDGARTAQRIALDEAEEAAREELGEVMAVKRRAEGRLDRLDAVEWLIARGMSRMKAGNITAALREGGRADEALGMSYEDGYWRVPV